MRHSLAVVELATKKVVTYPYTHEHLQQENSSTHYTGNIDVFSLYPRTAKAAKHGYTIVEVFDTGKPGINLTTTRLEESDPELIGGIWRRAWKKIELTLEEVEANLSAHRAAKRSEIEASAGAAIDVINSKYPKQVSDLWFIMLAEALAIKKHNGQVKTALLGDALLEGETNLELADKIINNHSAYRKSISPILGKLRNLLSLIETTDDVQEILNITWGM